MNLRNSIILALLCINLLQQASCQTEAEAEAPPPSSAPIPTQANNIPIMQPYTCLGCTYQRQFSWETNTTDNSSLLGTCHGYLNSTFKIDPLQCIKSNSSNDLQKSYRWKYHHPPDNSTAQSNVAANSTFSRCYQQEALDSNGNVEQLVPPEYLLDINITLSTNETLKFIYQDKGIGYDVYLGDSLSTLKRVVTPLSNNTLHIKAGNLMYLYQPCNRTRPSDNSDYPTYSIVVTNETYIEPLLLIAQANSSNSTNTQQQNDNQTVSSTTQQPTQNQTNITSNTTVITEQNEEDKTIEAKEQLELIIPILQVIGAILIIISIPLCLLYCIFTRCLKRRPDPTSGREKWMCRKANRYCKCWLNRPRTLKEYLRANTSMSPDSKIGGTPMVHNNVHQSNYQPQNRAQQYVESNQHEHNHPAYEPQLHQDQPGGYLGRLYQMNLDDVEIR